MASDNQKEILARRQNRGTLLSKPAFGFSFEYPREFQLKFDEELKDVLMLQFLIDAGDAKGEFTTIAGPDEAKSDVERAIASLELINNMVGPELFRHVDKQWIEKNLKAIPIGEHEGKSMILKSSFINFGIYFIHHGKLKFHFFASTQGQIDEIHKIILKMFESVKFDDPVEVLSPLVGETLKEYCNEQFNFKISHPESYEVITEFPSLTLKGNQVTVNNAVCALEFKLQKSDYGLHFRVVMEKTKLKFADYLELLKLQLTKSRVLLAAVREEKSKMNNLNSVDLHYVVGDRSFIKRVGVIDGYAVVISVEHYGVQELQPEKLISLILKSFKLFPRGTVPRVSSYLTYEHFDKNFSISFPDFCQPLYCTTSVVVLTISKNPEEYNGCFIQVIDFPDGGRPTIQDVTQELVSSFERSCTIMFKKDPTDVEYGSVSCQMTEFLIDGTWFLNPILNHPHLNSMAMIRVISTPKFIFLYCFINVKDNFNKSWETYGAMIMNSVRFH